MRRTEIAHAKCPHFPSLIQARKRQRHFVRIHQPVRPVKMENIDPVDVEPLQRILTAPDDILGGEIVALRRPRRFALQADATLGGDEHLLPQARILAQDLAKCGLRPSVAVNVRVIKQGVARIHGGQNRRARGRQIGLHIPAARQPPAAVGQTARDQFAFADRDFFHE